MRTKNNRLLLLILVCCLLLLPAMAQAEDRYGIIQGGTLHMRSGPSTDNEVVQTYSSGTWVEILGDGQNGFYHVEAEDGREGYMMGKYIIEDTLGAGDWGTVENGSRYVNLRTGPSTDYDIIGRYNTGDRFELLDYGEVFSKVRFGGSVVGYVSSGLVRLDNETVWEEEYINTVYGGKVNLRTGPSTKAHVLGSYAEETKVIVLIAGRTWSKVFVDDTFGYMDAEYLSPDKESSWHAAQGTNPFSGSGPLVTTPAPTVQGDPTVISFDDFTPDTTFYNNVGDDVDESQVDG